MVKFRKIHINPAGLTLGVCLVGIWLGGGAPLFAVAEVPGRDMSVELPAFTVRSERIANQQPSASVDMPVSALRFEPRVDVQGRNLAEAQADISIRGGIFENTGFRLGALALGDPQTGHYFAEIPVPPSMLGPATISTGADNALRGFNASVGSVAYAWRPIVAGGQIALGVGENRYNRQSLYAAATRASEMAGSSTFGVDVEVARSESDGTLPFGDHDFRRAAARAQWRSTNQQTDLFAGYQTKFFGWPNLYTPDAGFLETEDLETLLFGATHAWRNDDGSSVELGAFYRRNRDDYEFDRFAPNALFEHTTWSYGAGFSGRVRIANLFLNYGGNFETNDLDSTALTYGHHMGRKTYRFALVPEWSWSGGASGTTWLLQAGANYDDSNRSGSSVSPIFRIERRDGTNVWYVEYAQSTQLPTYTALNSSPSSGLFRGNADLGRTRSRNFEVGVACSFDSWRVTAAVFHRDDDDLVDWTFPGVRTATALDITTLGAELLLSYRSARIDAVVGYTWLRKESDFDPSVTGSYYALNFPRHRVTAALIARLGGGVELRLDNEYRVQERNVLRTTGDRAWLSNWGVYYVPPRFRAWEFSAQIDNVWDDDFQEVPSVPASRRQISCGLAYRW